jgi:hypothetical protein
VPKNEQINSRKYPVKLRTPLVAKISYDTILKYCGCVKCSGHSFYKFAVINIWLIVLRKEQHPIIYYSKYLKLYNFSPWYYNAMYLFM